MDRTVLGTHPSVIPGTRTAVSAARVPYTVQLYACGAAHLHLRPRAVGVCTVSACRCLYRRCLYRRCHSWSRGTCVARGVYVFHSILLPLSPASSLPALSSLPEMISCHDLSNREFLSIAPRMLCCRRERRNHCSQYVLTTSTLESVTPETRGFAQTRHECSLRCARPACA